MSSFTRFSGELHTHYAEEASKILGGKYKWIDPGFEYYLSDDNQDERVVIERGYLSDGASVPKLLQWLIPVWGKYGQCAVVHDKLCETWTTNKRKLNRQQVDEIFFASMKVAKVNIFRRKAIEFGVTVYRIVKRPSGPSPAAIKDLLTRDYVL
jgi:hypothetical protein